MTRTLRRPIFVIAALVGAAAYLAAACAQAQMVQPVQMACGVRDSVVAKLGEKYGEVRRGGGLAGPTSVYELWVSDKPPNTWTILKTTPNGLTCVMAVGDGWQDDAGELTPTGDPV